MSDIKIRQRLHEIKQLRHYITEGIETAENKTADAHFREGISVIVPVHRSEAYMKRMLQSLERQTLEADQFEVILIFNGEYDESKMIFDELEKYKHYTVLYSERGVARARNTGIQAAQYRYVVFLDVDDTISPNYLESSLNRAEPYAILLNHIYNVKDEKDDGGKNMIEKEIQGQSMYPENYGAVATSLSLNGAKVIPTSLLKATMFQEDLTNGEDVVLYMQLISTHKTLIKINPDEAVYYRHIVSDSLSRSVSSYQFNIVDRIKVLTHLQHILKAEDNAEVRTLIIDRMKAQAGFMNRYLKHHPYEYPHVIEQVVHLTEEYFPFERMNEDLMKRLYISYCFPPYGIPAAQ
jgi:glycosyltransferase involved in cell wall biosynthesis